MEPVALMGESMPWHNSYAPYPAAITVMQTALPRLASWQKRFIAFCIDDAWACARWLKLPDSQSAQIARDICAAIREVTDLPIIASFSADGSTTAFAYSRDTSVKNAFNAIARQFYRQGEATSNVNKWMGDNHVDDIVHVECYRGTSLAHFRDMLKRLIVDLGMENMLLYTFLDFDGEKTTFDMSSAASVGHFEALITALTLYWKRRL